MKNLILFIILIICYSCTPSGSVEKKYCGLVVSKGYEPPTSGYKSKQDANYFIIIKDKDCGKNIRIETTVPIYYELEVGSYVCFSLNAWQLRDYGNVTELKHLK